MKLDIDGERLLRLARESIAHHLGEPEPEMPTGDAYQQKAATFVTIHRCGALHGCIGSLEPIRTLAADVRHNAIAAAFHDPRAGHLELSDLPDLSIEVSLLGPLEPMKFTDEADALRKLRPHEDGVVLVFGYRRATFLPQVWEALPDPVEFMAHLKMKAGLYAHDWYPSIELYRYSLEKWREAEPHGAS